MISEMCPWSVLDFFAFLFLFLGPRLGGGGGGGRICSTSSTAFEDEWLLPLYEILARKPG